MTTQTSSCYRHERREAAVWCQRCERPICTECMIAASVGFQCVACVREGQRRTRQVRGIAPVTVTPTLIGVNAFVWLVVAFSTGNVSLWGGGVTDIHFDYALQGQFVDDGEYWRLATSGFLHYGLLHLGMNMLVLWWLGRMLEPAIGGARLLLIYAVSLLGGSMGALALDPIAFTAGASGAVYGLAGAMVVAEWTSPVKGQRSGILGFLAINLILSLTIPGVSLGGHIGGLLLGGLAAAILWGLPQSDGFVRTARAVAPLRLLPELLVLALGAGTVWITLNAVAPRWHTPFI